MMMLRMIQVRNTFLTDASIQIMSSLYFKSRFSRTVYKSLLEAILINKEGKLERNWRGRLVIS